MIDRQRSHLFRWRQSDIDSHSPPPVRLEPQAAPTKHATACRAEKNLQRRIVLAAPRVGTAWTEDMDTLVFVVIRPQCPIAPAQRAIARRDAARIAFECPMRVAAMAGASQYPILPGRNLMRA